GGVAQLEVKVGRSRPALAGPADHFSLFDGDFALRKTEGDGVASRALLLLPDPPGDLGRELLQVAINRGLAGIEEEIEDAAVAPGRDLDAGDRARPHRQGFIAHLAEGFDVHAG